ncbi:hypothetical protein RI543_000100 [Arxiozyma heterogenica]|uniref:J domain-containing protein n=1 Tax=Arxiozyma heterogenica TaxID=278026 RepID=A0AAN8A9V5_9SACH|nr:hypothetical protein RI543_000100 [Kazachstania heterogenica]
MLVRLKFYELIVLLTLLCNCFVYAQLTDSLSSKCNIEKLHHLESQLTFDSNNINKYEQLIKQTNSCIKKFDNDHFDDDKISHITPNKHSIPFFQLRNQVIYKLGLLHLSLNQNLKALELFESIIIDQDKYDDSYTELALKRLNELYIAFGYWNKVKIDEDGLHSMFLSLNSTLYNKIQPYIDGKNINLGIDTTLKDELTPMLQISPYNIDLLSVNVQYLTRLLSESCDSSIANELLKNYELVLDQFKTKLNINQRLEIHYICAIIQMLILNTDPTRQLQKCLAIDMDYYPCKQLTLLNSRLNKINPPKSNLLDSQKYAFKDTDTFNKLDTTHWEKLLNFYLDKSGKTKPCLKMPYNKIAKKTDNKFTDNYSSIANYYVPESLKNVFENVLPLGYPRIFNIKYTNDKCGQQGYFKKYIDIVLCEASTHVSSKFTKFLNANQYCKKALKEMLNDEQWAQLKNAINESSQLPNNFLKDLWNTYPTLAVHTIDIILRSNKKQPNKQLIEQIWNFFKEEKLESSEIKSIQKQISYVKKYMEKIRKSRQQQRQQNQQQQFFFNFGPQGNHHQAPPAPPPITNDKDYYKILGISKEASSKEIRRAYLNLTKKYHPDKQGALSEEEKKQVHEKMSEINEAYETLSDENKRKEYDSVRSTGGRRQFQQRSPFGNGPMNFMFQQNPGGGHKFPFGM